MNAFLGGLALGDVGADGNVLPRSVTQTEKGYDGSVDPVQRSIFGPVLDFAVPDPAARNRPIHLLEKILGMVPRVENAMVLADQFILGILADGAELVVYVTNCSLNVGHRHDGVLIQRELQIGQFFKLSLVDGAVVLCTFVGLLRFRNLTDC